MSALKIAKRYATALMDVCGQDQADSILSQLQAVEQVVSEKSVETFLANPESKKQQKLEVVQEIGKQVQASDLLKNFSE